MRAVRRANPSIGRMKTPASFQRPLGPRPTGLNARHRPADAWLAAGRFRSSAALLVGHEPKSPPCRPSKPVGKRSRSADASLPRSPSVAFTQGPASPARSLRSATSNSTPTLRTKTPFRSRSGAYAFTGSASVFRLVAFSGREGPLGFHWIGFSQPFASTGCLQRSGSRTTEIQTPDPNGKAVVRGVKDAYATAGSFAHARRPSGPPGCR